MKTGFIGLCLMALVALNGYGQGQEGEIQTLFRKNPVRASGGYGAIANKFTTINGRYANLVEVYGGWYVNHWFMLGLSGGATTNNLPVPPGHSAIAGEDLSYEYGQFGLATEYVLGSRKAIHLVFNLMTGAGFTLQYDRFNFREAPYRHNYLPMDENWFFVAEPGVQLEINMFRWMRFSPGYSYRAVYGSEAAGLTDNGLSGSSVNLRFMFGKF
ncbi:MAG: hypothetical protein M9954_16080 [Cyclobacteriaceae bacterium]|nr:hypothetical protein [Cyclobacteriaceae bacterium]